MTPRLGIIGSGSVSKFHIEAAKEVGFEVNSISASNKSLSAKKMSEVYKIKNYFEETQDLILSNSFDCLSVMTPPIITTELLPKLSELNVPILVEKPVTLKSAALNKFIDSKKIFVNFNRRFYQTVTEFKKLSLDQDGFFTFTIVESFFNKSKCLSEIESAIKNNSVHILDLLDYLCGEVSLLNPQYSKVNHTLNYSIYIRGKFSGVFSISFNSIKNTTINFESEQFNMKLSPIEELAKFNNIEILPPDSEFAYNRYVPKYNHSSNKNSFRESGAFKPGFLGIYRDFFDFCESGKISSRLSTLIDAKKALVLAEKLVEQYRSVLSKI